MASNDSAEDVEMENAPTTFDFSVPPSLPTNNHNSSLPSIKVTKPNPYTFDLAYLTAIDPNPLSLPPPDTTTTTSSSTPSTPTLNTTLATTARDGAQSLLNQLLTTCPITSTPSGLLMSLPQPIRPLPRQKPLPTPRPPTKWEQFARKKGIGKFNASAAGTAEQERRKKLVYDEAKGDWVPRWGYKGKNKDGEGEWLVEVDEKKKRKEEEGGMEGGKTVRGEGKRERMERVRRNERRMRANEKRSRRGAEE